MEFSKTMTDNGDKQSTLRPDSSWLSESSTTSATSVVTTSPLQQISDYVNGKFQPGSIKGSLFNLLNASNGSGVVVLPYALSQAGLGLGMFNFVICALLNYYSTFLLVRSAHVTKTYTYQELAKTAYGSVMEGAVKFLFFFNLWAIAIFNTILMDQLATTCSTILFGDTAPNYLISPTAKFWPLVLTVGIVFPISLFRELKSLRYVSLIVFFITIYNALVLLMEAFNPTISDFDLNITKIKYMDFTGFTSSISSIIFAYSCHPNVLDTYKELQRASKRRMSKVLIRTMGIACLTYFVIGFFGYVTFADQPDQLSSGDILLANYKSNPFITVAILLTVFSVMFLMPLIIKPAKDALRDMIYRDEPPVDDLSLNEIILKVHKDSNFGHFLLVSATTFSQMLMAMYFTNLADVINIIGGVLMPIICFILPSLFYLKLERVPMTHRKKIICMGHLILMLAFTVYSAYNIVKQLLS